MASTDEPSSPTSAPDIANAPTEEIAQLADEITRYLQDHEDVADTIDGIAHWWILRQRLFEERSKVEQAMEYLRAKGVVVGRELGDGEILYSSAPKNNVVTLKK